MDTPALPVQLVAGEKVKEVETAETEQQVERKSDPSGSSSSAERGNVNIGQQPCLEHASNSMQESTYLEEIGRVSTLDGVNKETDLAVNDACAPSVGVAVASQAIGVGAFKQPSMSTCHNQNEVDHHEEIIFNSNAEAMQILDETRSIRNDETQNAVCAAESEENPKVGDGEPDVDLNSVRKKLDFDVVADQKNKPRKENEIDLEREILIPSEPVKDVSNNVYEGNGEALCSVLPETIGVGDMPYWMEIPHAYVLEHMNDIEGMNDNTDLGRIERGDGEPDVDLNSVRRKLNFGVVADQKKQPHKENENDVEREILIPSEPVKAVSDNVHEGIEEALCSVLPENIGAHDMPYGMDVPEGRVLDHMNDIGGLKDDRNFGGRERKRRKRKRKDMKLVDDKIDAMVEELMNPVSPSKMAIQTAPNETEITDIRENTKGEDPLDPNCMMPIIDLPLMHKEKLKPKKMKRKKKRNKEKLLSADHLKAISEDVQLNGNTQPGNDVHGGGSVNLNNIEASVEFQYGDGHKLKRRRKRRRGKKTSVYGEKSLEQNYMGNFDLPLLEEQNSKPKKKKFEKSMCADRLNAGEIVHRESISRDCSEANQPSRIAQAGNGVDEEGSLEPNDTMGFLGFHVWYNQKEKPKKTRKRKKEKSKCADHLKGGVNETQLGEDGREADHAAGGDGEPLKHEDVQRFEDRNEHPYAMACPSNVDDSGLIKKVKKLKRTKKVTGRDGVDIKDETLRHAIECDEQATTQYIFTGVDDNVSADLCQKSKHEFIKDGSPQIPVPGSKKTKTLKKRKKAGRVDDVEDQKIRNHAGIPLSEHQVGLAMTVEIAPGAIVLALPAFVKC